MSGCGVYLALVSDRLDGALARGEERGLAAHLALCRDCREAAGEMDEMRRLLHASAEAEPPADLDEDVFRAVEADRAGLLGRLWSLLSALLPRPGLLPSTSAAALIVLVAVRWMAAASEPPRPPALPSPGLYEVSIPREASLLTVWDTSAETIVATVDPTGIAAHAVERARRLGPGEGVPVRIFLFERIVVRG